jgi:23S rRNA pseudouridine2604 synthase
MNTREDRRGARALFHRLRFATVERKCDPTREEVSPGSISTSRKPTFALIIEHHFVAIAAQSKMMLNGGRGVARMLFRAAMSTTATEAAAASTASTTNNMIRLNKLVKALVPCSRMEAEALITKGLVQIDGVVVNSPGTMYPATADITVQPDYTPVWGTDIVRVQKKITIMLNKPLGYVSTQAEKRKKPAVRLLTADHEQYRNPRRTASIPPYRMPKMAVAGRLDENTSGLLLFTQCGNTAAQIIGPNSKVEKEYLVRLMNHDDLTGNFSNVTSRLEQLRAGIVDEGQLLVAARIVVQNADQLLITLTSGRRHQIRRMIRAVGWQIRAIKRTRIGQLRLGGLPIGRWRYVHDVSRELWGIGLDNKDKNEKDDDGSSSETGSAGGAGDTTTSVDVATDTPPPPPPPRYNRMNTSSRRDGEKGAEEDTPSS